MNSAQFEAMRKDIDARQDMFDFHDQFIRKANEVFLYAAMRDMAKDLGDIMPILSQKSKAELEGYLNEAKAFAEAGLVPEGDPDITNTLADLKALFRNFWEWEMEKCI